MCIRDSNVVCGCQGQSFVVFVQTFGSGDQSARNEENLEFANFLLQTRRKQIFVGKCNSICEIYFIWNSYCTPIVIPCQTCVRINLMPINLCVSLLAQGNNMAKKMATGRLIVEEYAGKVGIYRKKYFGVWYTLWKFCVLFLF